MHLARGWAPLGATAHRRDARATLKDEGPELLLAFAIAALRVGYFDWLISGSVLLILISLINRFITDRRYLIAFDLGVQRRDFHA